MALDARMAKNLTVTGMIAVSEQGQGKDHD
jgi:hypothetical protein